MLRGGPIAYQPQVKQHYLGVFAPVIGLRRQANGARCTRQLLGSDVGLATTGVAEAERIRRAGGGDGVFRFIDR